ncbi:ATP-dependent endonuclease [Zhongshania guokunii]|uniref:ATP-dependent endonuclease n=1 Tax=Zhongshania guokunii TaxID=641783 RepID=A0ABV3U3Q4_9GAMM
MQVSQLIIQNFRGIKNADIAFDGHSLLVGTNNVGKSTICEALELALGPDRHRRFPVVEEFDFYNAEYLCEKELPIEIRIEVLLTDVTSTVQKLCFSHLERWDPVNKRLLSQGELDQVDRDGLLWALRVLTVARYNKEEDEFEASSHYASSYDPANEDDSRIRQSIRRSFGFIYLRTIRTGSRALSLERGSLLDVILRLQGVKTGIWEHLRSRLEHLDPPIETGAKELTPVLNAIEARLAEYIPISKPGESTKLFVSQLTREHLRKTLSFFISITADQKPVPFQQVGTGTLNTLVLALLSFIADLKEENIIFAMEEPEIALSPHTQRRIASYLITKTNQCFVTSHSPYIIETFDPDRIVILKRDAKANVTGTRINIGSAVKLKTYRRYVRRGFAEAMLGVGVIVAEGLTEKLVLQAAAEKMEIADPDLYPLDLSGVTIITTDGDGGIPEFGRFFVSLDMPTFAFFDKKQRTPKDEQSLQEAGFTLIKEIDYLGMEALLAKEVPIMCQWGYLTNLRISGVATGVAIPEAQPTDEAIQEITQKVLKDGKGQGRAADLIDACPTGQMPDSIVSFLKAIYAQFSRPNSASSFTTEEVDLPAASPVSFM